LEKQKKGKARNEDDRQRRYPQEAFLAVLTYDERRKSANGRCS